MARLKDKYRQEIAPRMMERFGLENPMQVPRLEKIVINRGVGKNVENSKRIDAAQKELAHLTGQWPKITRAKNAISNFRLRQNMPIGCVVTLRDRRMYEFFDRLVSVVIPRIRDFRGLSRTSFDGRGNYGMGLTDQLVFPEVKIDNVEFVQGMDISFCIGKSNDEMSLALLMEFGLPFKPA